VVLWVIAREILFVFYGASKLLDEGVAK